MTCRARIDLGSRNHNNSRGSPVVITNAPLHVAAEASGGEAAVSGNAMTAAKVGFVCSTRAAVPRRSRFLVVRVAVPPRLAREAESCTRHSRAVAPRPEGGPPSIRCRSVVLGSLDEPRDTIRCRSVVVGSLDEPHATPAS